eukprot:Amastigsp_a344136_47.p1 type:complete len:155 gc:universal Amastigsp_a344136_47:3-467(+)
MRASRSPFVPRVADATALGLCAHSGVTDKLWEPIATAATGAEPGDAGPRADSIPHQIAHLGSSLKPLRLRLGGGVAAQAFHALSLAVPSRAVRLLLSDGPSHGVMPCVGWAGNAPGAVAAQLVTIARLSIGSSAQLAGWLVLLERRCVLRRSAL